MADRRFLSGLQNPDGQFVPGFHNSIREEFSRTGEMRTVGLEISRVALCALLLTGAPVASGGEVRIGKRTVIRLLPANESRALITTPDDFVKRLSPFDRAARLKVATPVSEEQYLAFVGNNVRDWTDKEVEQLGALITALPPILRELPFPAAIQFIKTSGAEE